jgi:alanine-alpha-ketoisovalerate/valine-pyruvate aminotransferase
VSFIAFEDTGKVWPTHDLKASLLFCSRDCEDSITAIYNELFLCTSRFSLGLLEQFVLTTNELGLSETIWSTVDSRRQMVRQSIQNTPLRVDPAALNSKISVEWLDCKDTSLNDLELTKALAERGLYILPGRQFFWNSGEESTRHFNVRVALLKPGDLFAEGMKILNAFGREAGHDS